MQGSSLNMEVIMGQIEEHLLPTVDSGANGNVHHYNRVWEKIELWALKLPNIQIQIDNPHGLGCFVCGNKLKSINGKL